MLELDDLTQKEGTEYIHTIIEESSLLTALAANILSLSKIEQQTILTDRTRFRIAKQASRYSHRFPRFPPPEQASRGE